MFEREYRNFLNHQWQINLAQQQEEVLESEDNVNYYKDHLEQKLYLNETESYCKLNMLNLIDRDEINEIPDEDFSQKATLSKTQESLYESQQETNKTIASELQLRLEEFYQGYSSVKHDAQEIQKVLQNIKAMENEIEKIESKLNSSKCRAASDAEKLSKIQVNQLKQLGTDMMSEEAAVFELKQKIILAEKKDTELRQEFESLKSQFSLLEQNKKNPDHHLEKLDDWYKKGICTLNKLNGVADIKVINPSKIEITFDISPSFPCLLFKHANISEGFYITEAKIFKTFKSPKNEFKPKSQSDSNDKAMSSNIASDVSLCPEMTVNDRTLIVDPVTIELLNNWLESPASPKDCSHWLSSFVSSIYHHLSSTC